MLTHFLLSGHLKNRLGRSRLSDVSNGRMTLRTHNRSPGLLKKRLWWIRWSNVSRYWNTMRTHFCVLYEVA
jgi:hypothetical protein